MNDERMQRILGGAVDSLFKNQPNIFKFTSATHQTEWNLAHHLAVEIHRAFSDYDCDIDVVKVNYDNRRPDIVIHTRGTHENNLLVVEVKLDGHDRQVESDREKIMANWFREPLEYQFGAVVNLRTDGEHQVNVFMNRDAEEDDEGR